MKNKLSCIINELLMIQEDLPLRLDNSKGDNPAIDDFEIHIFEQTWGSTALGFGGYGGQMMTTAFTYVFYPICVDQKCFVYFAGEFAYAVPIGEVLKDNILRCHMEPVNRRGKYINDRLRTVD